MSILLTVCMLCTSFVIVSAAGGTGTAEDPILISTPQELQEAAIASNSDSFSQGKYYKLTADLDFTGFDYGTAGAFVPFGATSSSPFLGVFDGNGHTISNLVLKHGVVDGGTFTGLFGQLQDATVKNLGIISTTITTATSGGTAAVLAARAKGNVRIEHCFIRDVNMTNAADVPFGTFVGNMFWSNLSYENCYVVSNIPYDSRAQHGYYGDYYAQFGGTCTFKAVNCYTGAGDFAPDCSSHASDPVTTTVFNCYKNSDGVKKTWSNATGLGNSSKWLATAVSETELKAKASAFMDAFTDDTNTVNYGYPRLKWETVPGAFVGDSEENPYLIHNYTDFNTFRSYVNKGFSEGKCFKMTADIDIGVNVSAENKLLESFVGAYSAVPFKGIFDGDGHIFKNFNFELWGFTGCFGVFGNIDGNAVVKNTGVENVIFRLKQYVNQNNGGLIGAVNGSATVENCYARNVTTTAIGSYTDEIFLLGGLIGAVTSENATVKNCYATGCNLAQVNYDGGLIGCGTAFAAITNCYSDTTLGRFDNNLKNNIQNSYYSIETCPWPGNESQAWSDNYKYHGTQITAAELKTKTADLGSAFVPGSSANDGYPQLAWERGFDEITAATQSGNQIQVTVKKRNSEEGTLLAASYLGNELKSAAIYADKVTASGTYSFNLQVGSGENVKVFLLTEGQLTPLAMEASVQ